nr:unnamed protein product [Callosobruchus analis]
MQVVEATPECARKKKVQPEKWKRNVEKARRYHQTMLPEYPVCRHQTTSYQCGSLSMEDIKLFHQTFYANTSKIAQDTFILKYATVSTVKRIRNEFSNRPRTMATTYHVRKKSKEIVPVCKEAFLGILNLKRYRVEGILGRFLHKHQLPRENRGGDHRSCKSQDVRQNIVQFIKSLTVIEKHYCRGRSLRQYVSSDLSVKKLWIFYNNKYPEAQCKESYFRFIFNTKFNIGFNAPQVDVCSYCLEYRGKIKREKNPEHKVTFVTEYKLHKLKAKRFFEILKKEEAHVITLSYDCAKNLVLPKIPDQITYYKRQLYLYNFTVVIGSSKVKLTKNNVFMHTWLESESAKSSNEIASAVYSILKNLEISDDIQELKLVSDGCTGQNKNSAMIAMCAKWLANDAPKHIQTINLIFPVTGHSFLPPDRVFGQIEKKLKKIDTLTDVNDYYKIFENFGTVKKLGIQWKALDWRKAIADVIKPTSALHFKINSCKRIILTRGKKGTILVRGEPNYSGDINNPLGITKRGKQISNICPKEIELNKVELNIKKVKNVDELLCKHFGVDWQTKAEQENLMYYKNVVMQYGEAIENENSDGEEGGEEDGLCQRDDFDEDVVL